MNISREEYKKLWQKASPASPSHKTVPAAFLVGGLICAAGQGFFSYYTGVGLTEKEAGAAVSVTLIFIGVLLTALRLFDKIAVFAGAGTLVPITGFANSVAAPAIEFKTEGLILGTCVKMFTIAGPVLNFAMLSGAVYGVVLLIGKLI